MKRYLADYASLFTIAGFVIVLDQWTKHLIRTNLQVGEIFAPHHWLSQYARLVHWRNTGAAFGMLPDFGGVFTVVAIVVAAAIMYFYPQVPREDWTLRLAMGLQLGGAVGNLIDRLTQQGYVTDFISVGNFAVFNVADASVFLGVVILIYGIWIKERQEKASQDSPSNEDEISVQQTSSNVFPEGD